MDAVCKVPVLVHVHVSINKQIFRYENFQACFRCENFQACLGVKIFRPV